MGPTALDIQIAKPWLRGDGGRVTQEQFQQNKAKCVLVAQAAAKGETLYQHAWFFTFSTCMRAEGYVQQN